MGTHTTTIPDLRDLLQHASWLNGLARTLVGGEADDAAQDVWLQTTTHGASRADQPLKNPKAWLTSATRKSAAMRWRAASRRRDHERK